MIESLTTRLQLLLERDEASQEATAKLLKEGREMREFLESLEFDQQS